MLWGENLGRRSRYCGCCMAWGKAFTFSEAGFPPPGTVRSDEKQASSC